MTKFFLPALLSSLLAATGCATSTDPEPEPTSDELPAVVEGQAAPTCVMIMLEDGSLAENPHFPCDHTGGGGGGGGGASWADCTARCTAALTACLQKPKSKADPNCSAKAHACQTACNAKF